MPHLRYKGCTITFQEVPNEVSLVFNICNCPYHCPDCHSKYLWDDEESELLIPNLRVILDTYKDMITCVCLMGGDWNPDELKDVLNIIKDNGLKTCVYSGADNISLFAPLTNLLNYVKIGSYKEEYGGLNSPTTNQRFYMVNNGIYKDITSLFWRQR